MVVELVGSVRMCNGVQCFACRGGWRVFCENVGRVVDGRYSPDSHSTLHIILLDFVVADVYRAGVFRVVWLCCYMFSRLVVRIEIIRWLCIPKEF